MSNSEPLVNPSNGGIVPSNNPERAPSKPLKGVDWEYEEWLWQLKENLYGPPERLPRNRRDSR